MQPADAVKERAFIIAITPSDKGIGVEGVDELNEHLARGYRVVRFERLSEGGAGEPALAFVVAAKRLKRNRK